MWSEWPDDLARDVIRNCSRYRRLSELAEFAIRGHGYGESDGGFGVTYPCDLDEYDRAQGEHIPPGYVRVHEFFGPPNGREEIVPEPLYLAVLAEMLDEAGLTADAARVRARALVAE